MIAYSKCNNKYMLPFLCRQRRGWDYMPEVGLIMAGSINPDSRTVELSTDGGQTFQDLGDIPWGRLHVNLDDKLLPKKLATKGLTQKGS